VNRNGNGVNSLLAREGVRRLGAVRPTAVLVRPAAVLVLAAPLLLASMPAAADGPEGPEPVGPLATWTFNNGTNSLGRATSAQYQVGLNAVARDYVNGRFYVSPAGRYPVVGEMFKAFVASGGHGRLGYPVGEVTTTESGVAYQEFQLGNVYISEHGAFSVVYPMFRVYDSRGGVESLGAPVGRERVQGDRWVQEFEGAPLTVRRDRGQDSLGVRRGPTYYLKNEISPGEAHDTIVYGRADDTILVGDWDGTGTDTLTVRRGPVYHVKNSISGGPADKVIVYGRPDDDVLVGDWDGDGVDTLAVRRGAEYHVKNSISGGPADKVIVYGRPDDDVLVGDWDGDGVDTLAVRRGAEYHVKNSISGGPADKVIVYGRPDDDVLVGDWDGDGVDTLAVRRGAEYHVKNSISGGPADKVIVYGRPDDDVLVGDWNGDGKDTFTVRRGSQYHVKDTLRAGPADLVTDYGRPDDVVLVGDWDGRSRNYSRISQVVGETVAVEGAAALSRLTPGWANNSVNVTSFRKSSLTTAEIGGRTLQFAAYYNPAGELVLARRDLDDGAWEYEWTPYRGDVIDAHNSISIAVDGKGYLHVSWSQHNSRLRYARSVAPGSLELGREQSMVGSLEGSVTYPEFFRLPDGNLFFLYRDGASGNGNVVLNRYDTARGRWVRVHNNLIDGRDTRSAYWQAAVDSQGRLHLSWTWRDTPGVESNHDVLYARSVDATGSKWEKSDGTRYAMPITYTNAELAASVSMRSSLMNQTSMTVDDDDQPYIASYWREGSNPVQYRVIRPDFAGVEQELRRDTSTPEPSTEVPTAESTAEATSASPAAPTAEPSATLPADPAGEPTELPAQNPAAEPTESPTADPNTEGDPQDAPAPSPTGDEPAAPAEALAAPAGSPLTTASAVGPTADGWEVIDTGFRRTTFSLGGGGTKAVPIARPQILVSGGGDDATIHLVIRDSERGSKASLATRRGRDETWDIVDLTKGSVGEWEPSYDLDLWRSRGELDLFVQNVTQVDGEGLEEYPPQFVYVLGVEERLLRP